MKKMLSLLTLTLVVAIFPGVAMYAQAPTSTVGEMPIPATEAELKRFPPVYFNSPKNIYVYIINALGQSAASRNREATVTIESFDLFGKDKDFEYATKWFGIAYENRPSEQFQGYLGNANKFNVAIVVNEGGKRVVFTHTINDLASVNINTTKTIPLNTTVGNMGYSIELNVKGADIVGIANTQKFSIRGYIISVANFTEKEVPPVTPPTPPTPTTGLTKEYFDQHPIVYGFGTFQGDAITKEINFDKKKVTGKVSVKTLTPQVKCADLVYGTLSGPSSGYGCLGLLENEKDATVSVEVATDIGSLVFTGSLVGLAGKTGDAAYLTTTLRDKKYKLRVEVFPKTTVRIVLDTDISLYGVSKGTYVPCYYVAFGPILSEVAPESPGGETGGGKQLKDLADDLGKEVLNRKYVLAEPGIAAGEAGYKIGDKVITVALSGDFPPQGIQADKAAAIEARISADKDYANYTPLGFASDREVVVMVDGEIKGRRINFDTRRAPFDIFVNGKQTKIFVTITPVTVTFDLNPGWVYSENAPVNMYIIKIER